MQIMRMFNLIFDDRDWFSKLALTAIITALTIGLTPLLVGFLGWAILFGYQLDIIRNIRRESKTPLPNWGNLERYLGSGFNVLAAVIVYNLPNLLILGVSFFLLPIGRDELVASVATLTLSLCVLPVLIVYNLFAYPMLTLGMARYTENPRMTSFFDFAELVEIVRANTDAIIQYALGSLLVLVVLTGLSITIIGLPLAVALLIPLSACLGGIFAHYVLGRDRTAPPARRPQAAPPPIQQRPPRR